MREIGSPPARQSGVEEFDTVLAPEDLAIEHIGGRPEDTGGDRVNAIGFIALRTRRALGGRQFLMFADIIEVRERIADAQAEIAKASASQTAGVRS